MTHFQDFDNIGNFTITEIRNTIFKVKISQKTPFHAPENSGNEETPSCGFDQGGNLSGGSHVKGSSHDFKFRTRPQKFTNMDDVSCRKDDPKIVAVFSLRFTLGYVISK